MRSRFWWSGALVLGLMAGCGDSATDPGLSGGASRGGNGNSSIHGRVVTLRLAPDSATVPVAGARVSIFFVDTIPSDTTGTPPDSGMVPLMQFMAMLDPFPPMDTLRPDSGPPPPPPPPTDTIPPDTNPPPPPPAGCGRTGELVREVVADRAGTFRVRGLPAGKYDLVARAEQGRNLQTGYFCGVHLLEGQRAEVNIFLPPRR